MLLLIVVMAAASYYLWHLYSDQLETKQKLQTELTNVKVEKTALETKAAEPDQNDTVNKLTARYSGQTISSLQPIRYYVILLLYFRKEALL